MGRLSSLSIVNPVLTNLAVAYTNANFVGSALMPYVNVEKEAGEVPIFNKDNFKVYSTERGLRAKSNRINPGDMTSIPFKLTEHDLEFPIDYREDAESAFPLQQHATMSVVEGIRLRHEKMVADLALNPATYAASNKIAISGASSFANEASDPEGIVDDGKAAVRNAIMKDANTWVISYQQWRWLKRHPKLKAVLSDSRSRLVQLEDLREIFEIPNIFVGKAVYQNDQGVMADVWGGGSVLAYVPTAVKVEPVDGMPVAPGSNRSIYEPSFGYTLRKTGQPVVDITPEGGKLQIIRNTDIFTPFLLGADAGYLITDAG